MGGCSESQELIASPTEATTRSAYHLQGIFPSKVETWLAYSRLEVPTPEHSTWKEATTMQASQQNESCPLLHSWNPRDLTAVHRKCSQYGVSQSQPAS